MPRPLTDPDTGPMRASSLRLPDGYRTHAARVAMKFPHLDPSDVMRSALGMVFTDPDLSRRLEWRLADLNTARAPHDRDGAR